MASKGSAAPLMNPKVLMGLLAIAGVLFVLLLVNKPPPISEGTCVADCTTKIVYPNLEGTDFANIQAEAICGASNCLIEKMEYIEGDLQQLYQWKVTCECCVCTGASEAGLGICNYRITFLNSIGAALGLCQLEK